MVATLDDHGVFRPGEREAWDDGIDVGQHMSELMTTGEALHEAMLGREGVEEIASEHTEERTQAFV